VKRSRSWWIWALLAVTTYVVAAVVTHAFRHPELTDVQRLLRIWEALTWR